MSKATQTRLTDTTHSRIAPPDYEGQVDDRERYDELREQFYEQYTTQTFE